MLGFQRRISLALAPFASALPPILHPSVGPLLPRLTPCQRQDLSVLPPCCTTEIDVAHEERCLLVGRPAPTPSAGGGSSLAVGSANSISGDAGMRATVGASATVDTSSAMGMSSSERDVARRGHGGLLRRSTKRRKKWVQESLRR